MPKLFWVLPLLLILAACATEAEDTPSGAVTVVERYMQAKVEVDEDTIRSLLCSAMEAQAASEARTFISVTGVEIEDMACTLPVNSDVVTCSGQIVAQYGAESTSFPLTSYRVVQEDGEWKWCGEAG